MSKTTRRRVVNALVAALFVAPVGPTLSEGATLPRSHQEEKAAIQGCFLQALIELEGHREIRLTRGWSTRMGTFSPSDGAMKEYWTFRVCIEAQAPDRSWSLFSGSCFTGPDGAMGPPAIDPAVEGTFESCQISCRTYYMVQDGVFCLQGHYPTDEQ